jgi:hypothetical protein
MAHDVFISYSSKDKVTADAVCATLERHGIRCWIAPRDILPSAEWGASIINAIGASKVMVLIFSANANGSPQILREVERAVNRGVAILPFRIEDVPPKESLEYFIGAVHWLDALTPPLESHIGELAGTIQLLLSRMEAKAAPSEPEGPVPEFPASAVPTPQTSRKKRVFVGAAVIVFSAAVALLQLKGPTNPKDQYDLAEKYYRGQGGEAPNYQKAVRWYRNSAEQGFADAQASLAHMYANELGVAKDEVEAAKWYRRAAEQGHRNAQVKLAFINEEGHGVKQDLSEARRWYGEAASKGDAFAQNKLGRLHEGEKDFFKAFFWYEKAAAQYDANGQYNLGRLYKGGLGVPKDEVEAYAWFWCASGRHMLASAELGTMEKRMAANRIAEAKRRMSHRCPLP